VVLGKAGGIMVRGQVQRAHSLAAGDCPEYAQTQWKVPYLLCCVRIDPAVDEVDEKPMGPHDSKGTKLCSGQANRDVNERFEKPMQFALLGDLRGGV
jgi:hypothetical protein